MFMAFMAIHISSVTRQGWCISGLVNMPGMRIWLVFGRGLSEDFCSLCMWRCWMKRPHYDIAFLVCNLAYYPGVEVFVQRFSHKITLVNICTTWLNVIKLCDYTHTHTQTHTHAHTQTHTHTYKHTHKHTLTNTHKHTHTNKHAHKQTHTHIQTNTHTNKKHTNTHTQTNKHTHTQM